MALKEIIGCAVGKTNRGTEHSLRWLPRICAWNQLLLFIAALHTWIWPCAHGPRKPLCLYRLMPGQGIFSYYLRDSVDTTRLVSRLSNFLRGLVCCSCFLLTSSLLPSQKHLPCLTAKTVWFLCTFYPLPRSKPEKVLDYFT